jgi:hypothetical protein
VHTERKIINEQSTREDVCLPKLAHPFGRVEHYVVALVHFIAICHGEERFSLKSEYFPKDSAMKK